MTHNSQDVLAVNVTGKLLVLLSPSNGNYVSCY